METHKYWKHVATAGLYALVGYGMWKGGVNDPGNDNASVIVYRPVGCDMLSDLEVVPGHYTVTDVRSADAAILQTTKALGRDDMVVVYHSAEGAVFARRVEDFFDGRFVKTDETGKELQPQVQDEPVVKRKTEVFDNEKLG